MKSYNTIDKRIHQLCQIIAKINRTLVPEVNDDSHTNLSYEPIENRIYGRWFKLNTADYIFTLELTSFTFALLNSKKEVLYSYSVEGMKSKEIEESILSSFDSLGFKSNGLMNDLHFEIPNYDFKDISWQRFSNQEILLWSKTRELANQTCKLLLGLAQFDCEVRIWPHHFDTGIYFKVKDNLGIGFGLAMKDEMVKDSYFYMSAYPENYSISYDNLPQSNEWNWKLTDSWKGAILPLVQLENKSEQEQKDCIKKYLLANYHWIVKH